MKDIEFKRNASGYIDEPCYRAVTAPPRPGEIWTHSNSGAYMLVLANANGVCSTLRLTDKEGEGTVPVTCRSVMYAKPIMIGYCFENLLTQFVKVVKGDELRTVKSAVVTALGLPVADNEEETGRLKTELDNLKAGYKVVFDQNTALKAQLGEAMAAKAQGDELPYKAMYNDLLDRLIAKGRVE